MKKTLFFLVSVVEIFSFPSAHAQPQSKPLQQPLSQTFDSTGHIKAHSARVTVSYPAGWKAQEGGLPRIVRSFLGDYNGVPAVLTLGIEVGDEDVEAACAGASKEMWIQGLSAPNSVTNFRVIHVKGKPAALVELAQSSKFDGFVIHSQVRQMLVCHKRYMIKAICVTSNTTPDLAKSNMQKIAPLCNQYFDSLTLKG